MGSIPVTGFGDIYVVTDEGNVGNVQMHENGFTLVGGGGIHFAKEPREDFSPDMFWAVSRGWGEKKFPNILLNTTKMVNPRIKS